MTKWYSKSKPDKLDYNKPIAATSSSGAEYLLLPQIEQGAYTVIGYNWFSVSRGEYNSNATFSSVEEACLMYGGHTIRNVTLRLENE